MNIFLENPVLSQDWERRSAVNGAPKSLGRSEIQDVAQSWEKVIAQIDAMRLLDDDWDGLGASKPSQELIASAAGLAQLLKERGQVPPAGVVASTSGSIVFDWQGADGAYAEVEVDRPLHAEVMITRPGKPAEHWELPTD